MTQTERAEWQKKLAWLPAEHAAQWTEEVREVWLNMRKAYKTWYQSGTAPDFTCGSIKNDGELTPLFIVNDTYVAYHKIKTDWNTIFEPQYIKDNRARMSAGDYEESDDWTK
jgi:hypothetical protein